MKNSLKPRRSNRGVSTPKPRAQSPATAKRRVKACPFEGQPEERGTVFYADTGEAIAIDDHQRVWHWDEKEWKPITLAESARWYAEVEDALARVNSSCVIQMGGYSTDWFKMVAAALDRT